MFIGTFYLFLMQQTQQDKTLKENTQKTKQTLQDISNSIINLTRDDEYITKICISELEKLLTRLTVQNLAETATQSQSDECSDFFHFFKQTQKERKRFIQSQRT